MPIHLPAALPLAIRAGAISAALLFALPALGQDKDPLVAKVNGVEIHQSDLDIVEIEESRPISKTKTWVATRLVEKAAEV